MTFFVDFNQKIYDVRLTYVLFSKTLTIITVRRLKKSLYVYKSRSFFSLAARNLPTKEFLNIQKFNGSEKPAESKNLR